MFVRSLPMKNRKGKKEGWFVTYLILFPHIHVTDTDCWTSTTLGSLLLLSFLFVFCLLVFGGFQTSVHFKRPVRQIEWEKMPDVFFFFFLLLLLLLISSSSSSSPSSLSLLLFLKFHSYQYSTRDFSLFSFPLKDYAVVITLPASPAFPGVSPVILFEVP